MAVNRTKILLTAFISLKFMLCVFVGQFLVQFCFRLFILPNVICIMVVELITATTKLKKRKRDSSRLQQCLILHLNIERSILNV